MCCERCLAKLHARRQQAVRDLPRAASAAFPALPQCAAGECLHVLLELTSWRLCGAFENFKNARSAPHRSMACMHSIDRVDHQAYLSPPASAPRARSSYVRRSRVTITRAKNVYCEWITSPRPACRRLPARRRHPTTPCGRGRPPAQKNRSFFFWFFK